MEYSKQQLDYIQKQIIKTFKGMENATGFNKMATFSEYVTWFSHAKLAGYNVEARTGKMYRQEDNVRTYYE